MDRVFFSTTKVCVRIDSSSKKLKEDFPKKKKRQKSDENEKRGYGKWLFLIL